MKKTKRLLHLGTETLRHLANKHLVDIAGGLPDEKPLTITCRGSDCATYGATCTSSCA